MYIGSTSSAGLHHLVTEVVDNAVDEALAGHAHKVIVTLHADGSCEVDDDGRGIPVDIHKKEGVSALELVLTRLNAGGKFGGGGYKVSSGLHGVGVSAVNFLSEKLEVWVHRGGKVYHEEFARGVPKGGVKVVGKTDREGAAVVDRPISVPDFMATVCRALGINHEKSLTASGGRPVRVVDKGEKVIEELF